MLLILLMSKGSKEALTVFTVTYVTHFESVESGVCGLCMSGYHTDTPITIKAEAIHEADSLIH